MQDNPVTYHAPAGRANEAELQAARARFLADVSGVAVLESIPDPAVVVNEQRQIIVWNSAFLAMMGADSEGECLLGLRPGEAAGCIHAPGGPDGCGTGRSCVYCGAVNAILECLQKRTTGASECQLCVGEGETAGALDLLVSCRYLSAHEAAVVIMRDISAEKRRQTLERVFFHDVSNTATGIHSVAWLLNHPGQPAEEENVLRLDLLRLSQQLNEELATQRQLLAAEHGELGCELAPVSLPQLVEELAGFYRHHDLARGRAVATSTVPPVTIPTDPTLLRRVLGNLLKNALEATPEGGTVTVSGAVVGEQVRLMVHNPTAMSVEVQGQVFHRSFSTKQGPGRGIGTHSARLLTERYLGGKVSFESSEQAGTTFTVTLPLQRE